MEGQEVNDDDDEDDDLDTYLLIQKLCSFCADERDTERRFYFS